MIRTRNINLKGRITKFTLPNINEPAKIMGIILNMINVHFQSMMNDVIKLLVTQSIIKINSLNSKPIPVSIVSTLLQRKNTFNMML